MLLQLHDFHAYRLLGSADDIKEVSMAYVIALTECCCLTHGHHMLCR